MVDVAVSRMMGLVVVARLANRHGVKVELRPADAERGTVAEVSLPIQVLTTGASVGGRPQQPAVGYDGGRPILPEPLALEGGRGGYPGGRPFDPNPPMNNGGMLGAGGRSVPAWSDLTGASNGNGFATNGLMNGNGNGNGNGANGFYGPRSNEVIPPLPSGPPSGPQGFAGPDGLPRRNGDQSRPDSDNGFGATIPRQLPSNPENQGRGTFVPPVSAPPVPPVSAPPVPSAPPYARPTSIPPASEAPVSGAPTSPPAWPPVVSERDPNAAPHVPESLAAALDMTAEIPRYRPERGEQYPQVERPSNPQTAPIPSSASQAAPVSGMPTSEEAQRAAAAHEAATAQAAAAQATAAAQIAAAQAAARQRDSNQGQFTDETMELPIFRELESAWFTTARPADGNGPNGDESVSSQRISTGEPARTVGVPQQAVSPETREMDPATVGVGAANGYGSHGSGSAGGVATNPWRTAADEGWQAARAAAEHSVESTTTAGLPKRTPMAQLVPGGVDRGGNAVQRRTPEGVRGLLSAYHRGVQRGRTKEQSTNPEETPGGQQSSQAGKEHEA
jgi:hypothetical protein